MKAVLFYLLQVIACSGILYGYYHFFLRNKKFHQYNRYYLLLAVLLSVSVPFLQIPVYVESGPEAPLLVKTLTIFDEGLEDEQAIHNGIEATSFVNWQNTISLLYILAAAFLFFRFGIGLIRIFRMTRVFPAEKVDNIRFFQTNDPSTPFSFFHLLFWNNDIEINSDTGQQILRHELYHIRQKHSRDLLCLEIMSICLWVNPFFHLIRKEIKAIHEFLADKHAVEENKEWDYAELLLMHVLGSKKSSMVHPFYQNHIKRRIAMLTTSTKPGYQYLRKIMVLPLAVLIIGLFAFTYKNKYAAENLQLNQPVTIIVDAGHGGNDPGAIISPEITEASLNLEIAKTIRALADDYNIKVVLTRENDHFPGNAATKDEALKKRVEISKQAGAAAFISIHMGTSPDKSQNKFSGFSAYISNKDQDASGQLATAMLQNLNSVYKTKEEVIIRKDQPVYVLDKNSGPAVLLQCGFINNPKDLEFIRKKENQEKIAKQILEGIVRFQKQASTSNKNIQLTLQKDTTPENILSKVEIEPAFPGGVKAWSAFLEKNLDRDIALKNGAPKEHFKVFIQFVVNTDGSISQLTPLTKHGYGMEEEAIRVLKVGPKWLPAVQDGKKVIAYRKQAFQFNMKGKTNTLALKNKDNDNQNINNNIDDQPDSTVKVLGKAVSTGHPRKTSPEKDKLIAEAEPANKKASVDEVVLEGYPVNKAQKADEVVVTGYPAKKQAPADEVVVEGYPSKKAQKVDEVVVEGYPTPKKATKDEVIVEGYPSRKPKKVDEVVVVGRPSSTTAKPDEVIVEGYQKKKTEAEPKPTKLKLTPVQPDKKD